MKGTGAGDSCSRWVTARRWRTRVLWVLRDCLSGEMLLARSLLSACEADLADLLCEVQLMLDGVPIRGVISDGQHSIRKAVQTALPDVPFPLPARSSQASL